MRYPLVIAVLLTAGCATKPPRIILQSPSHTRLGALDVRFARVDIERMPILAATEAANAELRKVCGQHFALDYGYTAGPFPGTPEGPVTVHATNISFRQLLDEFCRQTGWRYRVNGPGWIEFQNGPVPGYKPEIRRPRPNQAMELVSSSLRVA